MGSAVLLVHGEKSLREAARSVLELAGHAVQEAHELSSAWRLVETAKPDLIIFPWTSLKPVRESLARLREDNATRQSRLIVWAEQSEIHEAVNALEFGADDCLGVPFDRAELIARVNACLRRPAAVTRPDLLAAGPVVLDKAVHCLLVNERPVDLAPTEFRLMAFFLENQGRVFSRDELLRRAWSKNIKAGHRTVDVHVRRLRQLLEPFGCDDYIQTVRGFGYRFAQLSRDVRGPQSANGSRTALGRSEIET
jgi:two-component system, OmpR family, phosphate regulon response regulator PhoB